MNDHQVATATRQNSAYRHQTMKGAFGDEGALRSLLGYRWSQLGFFAEKRENFFHEGVGCDAVLFAEDWDGAVFNELIGPTDSHHRCIDHLRVQMFHYRAAETVVQNVVFYRADHVHASGEKFECASIHGLDPARIDQCNGNSFFFQLARGFFGNLEHRSETEDRHVASVFHDFSLADFEKF